MDAEEKRVELETAVGAAIQEYQRGVDAIDDAVADLIGVNRTDLRAIDVLFDGPYPAGELAARVGLSPAAMTTALDRLERKKLINRVRDAADRRKVMVEITPEAQRLCWSAMGPIAEEGRSLLAPYDDADLVKFATFLRSACEANERHVARIKALTD